MPKVLEYPQASFQRCKELADAVEALGGSCSSEMCAKKLGKQHTSGSWSLLIGSAGKYGLIENRRGSLTVTDRYKQIKFAYTDDERKRLLRDAFLSPPVFTALVERFKGRELPIALLDKMLVREFSVEENAASRVAGYFVDGLKELELLDTNMVISLPGYDETPARQEQPSEERETPIATKSEFRTPIQEPVKLSIGSQDEYVVRLTGPGLDHTFIINEDEDFEMVNLFLKKVRKALQSKAMSITKTDGDTI